ncbi:unnamed protein product [Colias eurytheme]|nr:unnamed protein product [Colias eurytheme]
MKQRNTKPNKKKILRSSSSTTDEDIMSVHSDSDICDIISVVDEEDKDEIVVPTKYEKEAAIFAQIYEIDNIEKQTLVDNEKSETKNKNKIQKRERKILDRLIRSRKRLKTTKTKVKL